jgi:hypothetical protein
MPWRDPCGGFGSIVLELVGVYAGKLSRVYYFSWFSRWEHEGSVADPYSYDDECLRR